MTVFNLVFTFFRTYLIKERGLAHNTVAAYAEGIKQLFAFAAAKMKLPVYQLDLAAFNAKLVCEFLDRVEADNSIATRNLRLSAVRLLFRYLAHEDSCMVAAAETICRLATKKTPEPVIPSLHEDEVRGFVAHAAARSNPLMQARDLALFQLLYNTGGRASEIVGLNCDGVVLDGMMPTATLTGKGDRTRVIPLWPETAEALKLYLARRHEQGLDPEPLFLNPQRQRLSRFGLRNIVQRYTKQVARSQPAIEDKHVTTHTFRHTTAFHLLRVTQDLVTVQAWLGHRDINTTSHYCRTDPETKRRALDTFRPPDTTPPHPQWKTPDTMALLEQLTRSPRRSTLCEVKTRSRQPPQAVAAQNFT